MFETIIKIPYTTKPDMKKYNGPVVVNPPLQYYLEAKAVERELFNCVYESEIAIEKQLVKKTIEALNHETVHENIISFGSSIQEDIAIFYQGKLEAYYLAFPSGWNPKDKSGKTLTELHQPVADGNELRSMSDKISKILSAKHSFHRYVWNVVGTGMLSMHPDYGYSSDEYGLEVKSQKDLWFRLEHQTTLPVIKNEAFAFFINVDVLPYDNLQDDDKKLIVQSINSMTDAVLDYKNLRKTKELLNK